MWLKWITVNTNWTNVTWQTIPRVGKGESENLKWTQIVGKTVVKAGKAWVVRVKLIFSPLLLFKLSLSLLPQNHTSSLVFQCGHMITGLSKIVSVIHKESSC